jgi:YidC/Oxa1 family membrane protein insertase
MEQQRSFLLIALALVSFLLYQQWQVDYNTPTQPVTTTQNQTVVADSALPPSSAVATSDDLPTSDSAANLPELNAKPANPNLIQVTTDSLDIKIDPRGGDVVSATLLNHDATHLSEEKFVLLSENPQYIAMSGLVGRNGPDLTVSGRPLYSVDQQNWTLSGNSLVVPLTFVTDEGLKVEKRFTFKKGKHSIDVDFVVTNNTSEIAEVQPFFQLKQQIVEQESSMMMPTYRGGVYSTKDEAYDKYDFDDMEDERLNKNTQGGWVGMIQHYFVSAWVPSQDVQNNLYSRMINNNGAAIIGVKSPAVAIQPGQSIETSATLFAGPKNQEELVAIHNTLDLTVDYGFLWFISQMLFAGLSFIYGVVGNWGIAIIMITIVVKMFLYPLTKKQYESMAKMRALQPKMDQLKQRFGDDRQKFGQATMELYKKEKVNPMGGCLPLLLQMPILLALYWVFLESVELRHAPFGLWITDLSAKDPYYVLPVLFGASMFLMQKLSPTPSADPMQQKMMLWMPVIFSALFVIFPSGLVLYWFVSNLISIIQMLVIYKNIDKKNAAKAASKSGGKKA